MAYNFSIKIMSADKNAEEIILWDSINPIRNLIVLNVVEWFLLTQVANYQVTTYLMDNIFFIKDVKRSFLLDRMVVQVLEA